MEPKEVNNRTIFRFWFPLALTWIIMALEGPFLAALIARMPQAKYNLAAYGVAFSFAVLVESPIIMLMTASTALANNKRNYLKMLRFTQVLNGAITLLFVVILIPEIYHLVTRQLMGLDPRVSALTYRGLYLLIPWPAAIGFRRFFQGILIRNNRTRRVTYGTLIRLFSMMTSAVFLLLQKTEGIILGAVSLSVGVTAEALATWLMSRDILRNHQAYRQTHSSDPYLSYRYIIRFYYPLAITSFISIGIHPTVTFFLGKSRMALESLAILPVVNGFIFLFRSIALSYQEVGIALNLNHPRHYRHISAFARNLGLGLYAVIMLILFSPLSRFWFHVVSGLSLELTLFALTPVRIMALLPLLSTWLSLQRAILVISQQTRIITRASMVEIITLVLVLFFSISLAHLVGAVGAALAYLLGKLASNLYLYPYQRQFKRKFVTIGMNPAG